MAPLMRKRCDRCGHVGPVPVRRRSCRQRQTTAFGPTGLWCGGRLTRVVAPDAGCTQQALAAARHARVVRAIATEERRLETLAAALGRAVGRLAHLRRRAVRLAKASCQTDEEVAARQAARQARARARAEARRLRAMRLS